MSTTTPTVARPALKEWAAAVAALLDGRQTVLLRKGGIHEKRFVPPTSDDPSARFALFPTTAHSHLDRVRPEFRDLVATTAADSTETEIVVRAVVGVVDVIEVRRPERIADLEPFHLWTTESVQADRIDFRPRHHLAVLVVQAFPITPIIVRRTPDHGGCRSWVDLDVAATPHGTAGHSLDHLRRIGDEIRSAVG